MLRLKRRPRKKRRLGSPASQQEASVRRLIRREAAPPANDEVTRAHRQESSATSSSAPLHAVAAAPSSEIVRGPRSDLAQDPVRLQRALENLRVEHSELWLTANELKDKIRDLLEEKTAFEDLIRRYRDLFYLAPDAQLLTDGTGRIKDLNFAACRLLHADPTVMTNSSLLDGVDPPDVSVLCDLLARVSQGQSAEVELRLKTRLGARPAVRIRACLLPTLNDQILLVLQRVPRTG